jgi:hypothetical protein
MVVMLAGGILVRRLVLPGWQVRRAEKWIYPKLGVKKLKDFKATDADRFLKDLGKVLGKRSLMMIKSTLRRSIRRAQVQDLIGKNVV